MISNIIIAASTLIVSGFATYLLWNKLLAKKKESIIRDAENEAEVIRKEKILQAKEKFLQLKTDHEKMFNEKNNRIVQTEAKQKQRETALSQKFEEIQRKQKEVDTIRDNLTNQLQLIDKRTEELDRMHKTQVEKLESISSLSAEDAKQQLIESLKAEAKTEAMSYINEIMDEAKMTAHKEAKRIVVNTIQRVATESAIENSVTVFHIDSDEIKGRIIGREGRNIRALEAATGVEIIVDDTPEAIILSAFDPVRRETARLALHQLIGRAHV